jgi:6,7-dimethyl-8-ribityllumazine synthase
VEYQLEGKGLGIGLAAARFNSYLTDQMLEIALKRLSELNVAEENVVVVRTPGAFELPLVARRLADRDDIDAVICIGCVIRGETDHYDHVAYAASTGISKASEDFGKPVIFGVLTTENTEQAVARIGHTIDYVDAAVEMANTMRQIHELT